jgi:hypothetical protein
MKININNDTGIEKAISEANGNARKRLISQDGIIEAVKKAESKLFSLEIPKKYWAGCTVEMLPEKVSRAYARKGKAEGTYCKIERFSSDWFVIGMDRRSTGSCPNGAYSENRLTLGQAAIDAMPKSFSL